MLSKVYFALGFAARFAVYICIPTANSKLQICQRTVRFVVLLDPSIELSESQLTHN
jgi:hypothetical protein